MFNRVARRYDAANRVMSGGIDIVWRKKAIARLLQDLGDSPRVLDLGAGTLDGAIEITRQAPGAQVAAADFAREMLRAGRRKIPRRAHIATHAADGHRLPYRDDVFDAAFSAFCVRNLADLRRGLGELRRVVHPAGRVVILEFLRPDKPRFFFDRIWNAHVLPAIGRVITGRPRRLPLPARVDRQVSQRRRVRRGPARGRLPERGDRADVSVGRRHDGGGLVKLVVAVGGASGSIYAKRLLDVIAPLASGPNAIEIGLVFSHSGSEVWAARDRRDSGLSL